MSESSAESSSSNSSSSSLFESVSSSSAPSVLNFDVSFSGQKLMMSVDGRATVADLKSLFEQRFCVRAVNQKLLGLPAIPKGADDFSVLLTSLPLKQPQRIMLMGTTDADLTRISAVISSAEAVSSLVVNDLDADISDGEGHAGEESSYSMKPENVAALSKRVTSYAPKILHGFRKDSMTLVLDVDYTLFDHRSVATHPKQLERPYLHEFLAIAFMLNYDIIIWSATSLKWIEVKMEMLGVFSNPHYKIAALFDNAAMISIIREGRKEKVEVKPLQVIWGLFPEDTHPSRTIMFDDLRRNFLMNPKHGLRIHACRNLPETRATDRELADLSLYLVFLSRSMRGPIASGTKSSPSITDSASNSAAAASSSSSSSSSSTVVAEAASSSITGFHPEEGHKHWRSKLKKWRTENDGQKISKELLLEAMKKGVPLIAIANAHGFEDVVLAAVTSLSSLE